jgi:prolyl-tRNA synthetase
MKQDLQHLKSFPHRCAHYRRLDRISRWGGAADRQIKSLVFVATRNSESGPVLILLRGDHQLHETKLADSLGATAVRPAQPEEIRELLGAGAGSLGGVGAKAKALATRANLFIVADLGIKGRHNMTTGANKDDHHLRGVDVERDIGVDQWADLRAVNSGESCRASRHARGLQGVEIGHLQTGHEVLGFDGCHGGNQDGKPVPIVGQLWHWGRAYHRRGDRTEL